MPHGKVRRGLAAEVTGASQERAAMTPGREVAPLIAALVLSGCATISTLSSDRVEDALCHTRGAPPAFPRIYSGAHADLFCLGGVTGPHAGEAGFLLLACLI